MYPFSRSTHLSIGAGYPKIWRLFVSISIMCFPLSSSIYALRIVHSFGTVQSKTCVPVGTWCEIISGPFAVSIYFDRINRVCFTPSPVMLLHIGKIESAKSYIFDQHLLFRSYYFFSFVRPSISLIMAFAKRFAPLPSISSHIFPLSFSLLSQLMTNSLNFA